MNILESFNFVVKNLIVKPFVFWPADVRNEMLDYVRIPIKALKSTSEKQDLKESHAYRVILAIELAVGGAEIKEVSFIQNLSNLLEVYRQAGNTPEYEEVIVDLQTNIELAKKNILEYHLGIEVADRESRKLSPEEIKNHDLKIIEKIGFFYILEYTLYVIHLLSTLGPEDGKKLFYLGLKTKEANLPPFTAFADSFRRDLCLKIYQSNLRTHLFEIFFQFEEVFKRGEFTEICMAFKQFNISLLKAFQGEGITMFKAIILTPFGSNVPIAELIEKIDKLGIGAMR